MRYDVKKHNAERVISLPDDEIAASYLNGYTGKELSFVYGASVPTVWKSLRRSGVTPRAAARRAGVGVGSDNPAWAGGRRQRSDGYWMIWTPDGDRLEHRVVMEKKLGRPLTVDEIVHHIDEDKSNNSPENLDVMSQSDHARHHAPAMHKARYENG